MRSFTPICRRRIDRLHVDLYASEGEGTLVGVFGEKDEFQVEAFARASEDMETEIRVNGKWIAGNQVLAVASD
jgi:hypothetical protein